MDISIDTIVSIASLLIGGGGGAFFTWRWQRKKAEAEAKQAEAEAESAEVTAAKEVQDVYQQMVADVKADRDEQKRYIAELKEDRLHLRRDRDELRERQDKLEEEVRGLQRDVARNGRMVECMRPFLCGRAPECKDCVPVTITAAGEVQKQHLSQPVEGVEPGTGGVF
jgi:hypothetical protein